MYSYPFIVNPIPLIMLIHLMTLTQNSSAQTASKDALGVTKGVR